MHLLKTKPRCAWVTGDPIYINYHDNEWGIPVYNERLLFEFLILEGMQAGLSWLTVLKKRDNYRIALDNFNAELIANYSQAKFNELMSNSGIIRNQLKINSIIENAKAFLKLKAENKDFSRYIWSFVNGQTIKNHWENLNQIPRQTLVSDTMSKDLKKRGFKFVGSTICYAFMQATGMVNDHTTDCFCYMMPGL